MPRDNDNVRLSKSSPGVYNGKIKRLPNPETTTGKIWLPPPPSNERTDRPQTPELVAHCQEKPKKCLMASNNNSSPIQPTEINNYSASFDANSNSCTKVNFLNLLQPKKCKHSPTLPGCPRGITYPICSWFASPKYFTCSNSTKPQCYGPKCWFYDNKQIEPGGTLETTESREQDQNGQQQQEPVVRRRLSSNTLHGVRSVDDLRAWSVCGEDQRRYFMEQMMALGKKGSSLSRIEEQYELDDEYDDADAPSDASAMQMKYERLLRQKDEEIERLKAIIRELEGQPGRPAPSSMRSLPVESKAAISAAASDSQGFESDYLSQEELASGKSKSGRILAKDKSSTKRVPKTESSTTEVDQQEESTASLFDDEGGVGNSETTRASGAPSKAVTSQDSEILTQKSKESLKSGTPSRMASETVSPKSSQSATGVSKAVTPKESSTASQKVSEATVGESEAVIPNESSMASQKASEAAVGESKAVTPKGSSTVSQKVSEATVGESEAVTPNESSMASQKTSEGVVGGSKAVTPKESRLASQKVSEATVGESEAVTPNESNMASQKASEGVVGGSKAVTPKESSLASQKPSEIMAGESNAITPKESTEGLERVDSTSSIFADEPADESLDSKAVESTQNLDPTSAAQSKETSRQASATTVVGQSVPVSGKASDISAQVSTGFIQSKSSTVSRTASDVASGDAEVGEAKDEAAQYDVMPVGSAITQTESAQTFGDQSEISLRNIPRKERRDTLADEVNRDILGGIMPLQSNESLCMELMFIEPPSEDVIRGQTISEAPTVQNQRPIPQGERPATAPHPTERNRGMSLAEIGGYEERRKPFTCSCETSDIRQIRGGPLKAAKSQDICENPYGIRVVVENNRIRKMQGVQVLEELNPETLVAEYEFLRERVTAQRLKITELEAALYRGISQSDGMLYRGPSDAERSQLVALQQQVASLEQALAERECVAMQYYTMLETASKEKNELCIEIRRNQVILREYQCEVTQLQKQIRNLESSIGEQRQEVLRLQHHQQQEILRLQQQQQMELQQHLQQPRQNRNSNDNYPNYYPGGGTGRERGDHLAHFICRP